MILFCPTCVASRTEDQQDEFGHCRICGTKLLADDGPTEPAPPSPSVFDRPVSEPTPPELVDPEPPSEPAEPERPPVELPPLPTSHPRTVEAESPEAGWGDGGPFWPRRERVEQPVEPESADPEPEPEPSSPSPDPAPTPTPETVSYDQLVAGVEEHLAAGYEMFGLIGHASSGKTHCLKALTYLLEGHGIGSQKAGYEFRRAPVPGPSAANVFHYAYTGPADQKWIFVDAGGELYQRLHRNDWSQYAERTLRLTRLLHRCSGLFCFLHLNQGHFGGPSLAVDPVLARDPEERQALEKQQQKDREAQAEVEFFKHFFLFLRALKAENGDAEAVIARCREADTLDDALRSYYHRAPRLDAPVMFFFSQADGYDAGRGGNSQDFAVAPGVYVSPRRARSEHAAPDLPVSVFAARYLPALVGPLAAQVKRFKIDFLQSYEDHVTDRLDAGGDPITETYWHAPEDPRSYLSIGLMAGLEFLLRNQPRQRRWWQPPELDSRRALLVHRWLHKDQWRGVAPGLLGSFWRPPRRLPAATGEKPEDAA